MESEVNFSIRHNSLATNIVESNALSKREQKKPISRITNFLCKYSGYEESSFTNFKKPLKYNVFKVSLKYTSRTVG